MNPLHSSDLTSFNDLLGRCSGRHAVDVGANTGGYTDSFLSKGASRVLSIEPGPRMAASLRERYRDDDRVSILQVGISDRSGILRDVCFHNCWTLARRGEFPPECGGVSLVSPGAAEVEGDEVFDVETETLDAACDRFGFDDVSFLKVDVDGYEDRVLRGGTRVLADLPPVYFELSYLPHAIGDSVPEMLRRIYDMGYVVVTLDLRVATLDQVEQYFPWHTSFDVLLLSKDETKGLARV